MHNGSKVRRILRRFHHGVLATISKKMGGYPHGSLVPFVLDHAARPVILISGLAEHTHNIDADPRTSLLVHEPSANVQAGLRITLIGDAARCADQAVVERRYLACFPDASRLLALGDFAFYCITPLKLRHIGGFGAIHWVDAADYAPPWNSLVSDEKDIIAHIDEAQSEGLREYCRRYCDVTAGAVRLVGVDCDGIDLYADGKPLRIDFAQTVTDAVTARQALVAIAKSAQDR